MAARVIARVVATTTEQTAKETKETEHLLPPEVLYYSDHGMFELIESQCFTGCNWGYGHTPFGAESKGRFRGVESVFQPLL